MLYAGVSSLAAVMTKSTMTNEFSLVSLVIGFTVCFVGAFALLELVSQTAKPTLPKPITLSTSPITWVGLPVLFLLALLLIW